MKTVGYACLSRGCALEPWWFERRAVGLDDVLIDIQFCGVSHCDIHQTRNEWNSSLYPLVPGREMVGQVAQVGVNVHDLKPGDMVGVGGIIDSCGLCQPCLDRLEQFCIRGATPVYNGYERDGETPAYGGFSSRIIVDRRFVLNIPASLDPASAAPLLGAGSSVYTTLRQWMVRSGARVGIIGIGGLGHLAVKFAHAFGAETIAVTRSPQKARDAKRLGADRALLSTNADEFRWNAGSFDFLLNTIPVVHDVNPYLSLLKPSGTMTMLGTPEHRSDDDTPFKTRNASLSMLNKGTAEMQDMLYYCDRHKIVADIEIIPIQKINEAYERIIKGDVRYCFSVDLGPLHPVSG